VNNTSQKTEEKSVIRKYLSVESNRCVGSVAAGENDNEYCKQFGSFYCDRTYEYFSDDWWKCRKCNAWYHKSCFGGKGK